MEERLSDVAGADSRVVSDLEAELAGDGEAEAVWALAGPPHLELWPPCRKRTVGEDRQRPQPFELSVQGHPRDQVIGPRSQPINPTGISRARPANPTARSFISS